MGHLKCGFIALTSFFLRGEEVAQVYLRHTTRARALDLASHPKHLSPVVIHYYHRTNSEHSLTTLSKAIACSAFATEHGYGCSGSMQRLHTAATAKQPDDRTWPDTQGLGTIKHQSTCLHEDSKRESKWVDWVTQRSAI